MPRSLTVTLMVACLAGSAAAHAAGPPTPANGAGETRAIIVDAAAQDGTLRSLLGVNGAPAPGGHKPEYFKFGGWNMPDGVDASSGYRMARIDLIRTHDGYGPADIDAKFETAENPAGGLISAQRDRFAIFPDPHADPSNPDSYNFGPTDRLIASIRALGAQVIFRLGRSEGSDPTPPEDFDRYAAIARHVVLHYNHGWAHGHHYDIRYWEIWNEPDLGKLFWSGTAQEYYEFYGKMAQAVKSADRHAWVGAPAIAKPNDETPYRDAFLSYVRAAGLPLDFYSWHWYATDSNDPLDFVRIARDLRSRLDKNGFAGTASFLTEWNYGLSDPPPSPLVRASFITSALIYMQDAPVDAATLYRADNVFGTDGATPDKTGQALIALGRMKDTPLRLKVRGADQDGFAVAAGRSREGTVLQVLISNYQIPEQYLGPREQDDVLHVPPLFDVRLLARRSITYTPTSGYDLKITNLPANRAYRIERCRISRNEDFTPLPPLEATGTTIHVTGTLPAPAVELVRVRLKGARTPSRAANAPFCG